jgi:anti-sigma B factor antagonist
MTTAGPPEEEAAPSLTVTIEHRAQWVIVRLSGELDHRSRPGLVDHLHSLLHETDLPRIFVDLNRLQFCDSSGVACLVMAWKVAQERGGSLVLLRPVGEVARLLSLLGLSAVVPVLDELPG